MDNSSDQLQRAFSAECPKISLHDHLDGSLRLSTIIDLSKELQLSLPAKDEVSLGLWVSQACSSGSLVEYLKTFSITSAVMQTASNLERVAREFVLDCAKDGVIYAETRWAPLEHLRGGLTPRQAIMAVESGLREGMSVAASGGQEIEVRQILTALRHENNSLDVAKLVLDNHDAGVVGFDLAGPEAGFPPSLHSEALVLLHREGMNVTIHAGEADGPASVKEAIEIGYATRIGHGVRIAEDIRVEGEKIFLGTSAEFVKQSGATLEVAPRSNLQTETSSIFGQSLKSHPFDLLYRAGFPVTVNPDNRLMSASNITDELIDLAATFGYNGKDFLQFQRNALERSFCKSSEKQEFTSKLENFTWNILS